MLIKFVQLPVYVLLFFFLVGCKTNPNARLDFSDGSYEGQINDDGEKHGFGIYRWIDGSIYEGDYLNDLRHGHGRFLWSNGESYVGDYLKDERTGKGIYSWPDGSSYKGEFLAGKRHGWGLYQSADGVIYEGEWFDDLQHGQGTLTYADGRKEKGIWRQGIKVSKPAILPTTSEKPELPKLVLEEEILEESSVNDDPKPDKVSKKLNHYKTDSDISAPSVSNMEASPAPTYAPPQADPQPTQETPEKPSLDRESSARVDEQSSENASDETDEERVDPDWTGTVSEAETFFITELVDGFDTVRLRTSGIPFTGRMRIVDSTGLAKGEVNLLDGRMHGEEIFYDQNGEVIERNYWANGRPIGQ